MFDYESMIKRAIKFFPTWSDIRKRYKKSNGGNLLSSITEESVSVEDAIQEYIDYYFLVNYEGKESEVMAFAYRTNIGKTTNSKNLRIEYDGKQYPVTTSIDDFNNNDSKFYYENGYIYMRYELYVSDSIKLFVNNDNSLEYKLELYHVWNIYDEFATFLGMQRHEKETNLELYNRMLYFNKNKPNGTAEGLKHALISELMIYEPDIKESDIEIKKAEAEDLRRPYQDYDSLLDKLNEINKDVYRWKRWDLDEWTYSFKTLEYLPYKWNETLTKWQNGIGYNDDLKVIVSSSTNETDANITLYEKSQEKLLSYIHNNDIYKPINFKLKQYKDVLNSIPVSYKIQASPMTEIKPSEFKMNIYENTYVDERVSVESICSTTINKDVMKVDNSEITDIYPYKLQFLPRDGNYDIEIKKARILYKKDGKTDHVQDLLIPNSMFVLNSLGYLVSNSSKKNIKNLAKLNSYNGLINVDTGGITLANNTVQGSGSISINGLGGSILSYAIDCDLSKMPNRYIKYNTADCEWNSATEQLFLLNNGRNKTVEIDIDANELSFDIQCENAVLVYVYNEDTNNWSPEEVIGPNATWSSNKTKKFRNIKIKIESNSDDKVVIGNFKYSKYELQFSTNKNNLFEQNGITYLPNLIENTLYFKLISYSGSNPIIKGIYIGEDITNAAYTTVSFDYEAGFTRVVEIECNCKINLLKMNFSSTKVDTIYEDYSTYTSYKGTTDEAWIRLNLENYSSIEQIITPKGSIEMIEESGVTYYNLRLNKGDAVSYIRIVGNKNIEKRVLSLYDMILTYNPNFNIGKDKVYCSKLTNGLIISKNGDNSSLSIMQLDNNLFAGLNILKYEFSEIPNDLNIVWGTSDNKKNYGFVHTGDFEYIAFYKADSEIHTALNSYNLFINEVRDIKIVNNFNPTLDSNTLNFYTVEPYKNSTDVDIRFNNDLDADTDFNKLKKWCVGQKTLSIKCDLDLMNSIIYNVSETYVSEEVKLNQLIPIKETYNDNTVHTNRCVIDSTEDMQVIYKTYDGTSDTKDLLIKEAVEIQSDGFKKLEYANIDRIFYIGSDMGGTASSTDQFTDYSLLEKEGIIIWNNLANNLGKVIYIQYTIKQPIAFLLSDEFLYKTISYNINAYKEIARYNIKDMSNGDTYNLNKLDKFKDCDLIYVSCTEPTFEAIMTDDIIKFNKYSTENNVLVKTGYYYINGKEYYLFSNDGTLKLDTDDNMYSENIDIEDGRILTYKTTDNRLKNTSMIQKGINNLFNFDYRDTLVKGISNFNKFTSCDSFYKWCTNGMKISLTDKYGELGCNDLALAFTNAKDWGYSYINITDYLYDDKESHISFISSGVKVYIGHESKFLNIDLNDSFNIKIDEEIKSNTNLKSYTLSKKKDTKYYLIVKGNGILDDIIITDNVLDIFSCHNRNIDQLGFDLSDNKTEGDIYRLELDDKDALNNYCASIGSDGRIRTTSRLDWNITKLAKYSTREEWLKFDINNLIVEDTYIQAPSNQMGSAMMTEPIFIENPYTVNRLVFKVNDVDLDELKNIKIYVYTSNERNGQYRLYTFFDNNYGFVYGDYVSRYIKVKLEIPKNKVVNNLAIYAEYKSEDNNIIKAETLNTGYLTSNIFDSQECLRYKLSNIDVEDISDLKDVEISIRAAGNNINVWTDWQLIKLKEANNIAFNNARYFQIKILLKSKYAYVKFNNIDLEVI